MTAPVHRPQVNWFDPVQLAGTAIDIVISAIFGRESDFRAIEPLYGPQEPFCVGRDSEPDKPVWLDYVGDTGDGWNSTYTIAYWLAQPKLTVATEDGTATAETRTNQVLILGGDQVYPVANRTNYQERLVAPYRSAREQSDEPCPEVYAIPGNHDWYDNLVSFTRLFCSREWLGGWRMRQKRSYFVLHLPYGWWLVGTDIQLGSDIDSAQLDYFKDAAKQMKPDDRIILCVAEPHWIYAHIYNDTEPNYYNEKTLSFLESPKVFGDRIQLFLAGDLHHYRRHEGENRRQKITAGGGGASLHATHGPEVRVLQQDLGTYRLGKKAVFPDEKTSRALTWRNLLFPFINWKFGILIGAIYMLVAWTCLGDISKEVTFRGALGRAIVNTIERPGATLFALAFFFLFIFFNDTHYRSFRYKAGVIHSLLQVAAVFFIGWGAERLTLLSCPAFKTHHALHIVAAGIVIWAAGWLIGSMILGGYLLVALNKFDRQSERAFASLHIEDYKNFLRMRFDRDGGLTIFPIGITKVARKWKPSSSPTGPKYEPDGDYTNPFLIEDPIVITPDDLRRPPRT